MPLTRAERVERRRAKLRASGLRPVQLWLRDTSAPGFAEECRRQCLLLARSDETEAGRQESEFWERISADAWDDLG